mmetsp:Transcript_10325/g.11563  ORF Transcript_10325/g.11563 Transcript_10325/m.11563 type:complete len:97 (-) Transcript_10325:176-466(-)
MLKKSISYPLGPCLGFMTVFIAMETTPIATIVVMAVMNKEEQTSPSMLIALSIASLLTKHKTNQIMENTNCMINSRKTTNALIWPTPLFKFLDTQK